jgi:hypothetical protein
MRLPWIAPLIAPLAGCGAGSHTAATHLPDGAGPVRATYVVSAPVLKIRGTQKACDAILSSAPPAGCFGPCRRTAWALVAVANRSTVRAIRQRYGDVIISAWLRRSGRE